MIHMIRKMQQRWLVVPWSMALLLGIVACEGPHSITRPPIPRKREIARAPVKGQVVYKAGMPGVIEKAIDLVDALQKAYSEAKSGPLDTFPFVQLKQQTLLEHKNNLKSYDAMVTDMKSRGISEEMIQRVHNQRKEYEKQYKLFYNLVESLTLKDRPASLRVFDLKRFENFLKNVKPRSHQTPFDPNNLPYARIAPVKRPPMMDTQSYAKFMGLPEMPEGIPIANPTADDLKETKDIQLTQGIKDLAAKLKSPLAIYKWVRDNVAFYPTYGSIQGADYCRMSRKCNAFDTASLLIALLRAQKIPARYVFGTVEVPIERARNWVGRFGDKSGSVIGRALASSGIPATTMISGATPVSIRMEHVWVEAWVDYVPSRGRIHKEGDTWIPMDGSFKQHTYAKGIEIDQSTTGVDMKKAIDDAKKSVKSDSLDGITQGPDATKITDALKQSGVKLDAIIQAKDFDISKLKNLKKINAYSHDVLLASLPYEVRVVGQRQAEMPDRLRHYIKLSVTTQIAPLGPWGHGGDPNPDFSVRISLPEIAGKKLSLAYNPASASDQATMEKYIKSAGGDLSKLPKTLPSVIRVKPHIMLDNKTLGSGKACRLGGDNRFHYDMTGPGINKRVTNTIAAGGYQAVVVNHGSIPTDYLKAMRTQTRELRKKFENKTVSSAKREEIQGAFLHSAGLNYWIQQDQNNTFLAARMGVLDVRQPSVGLFAYELSVKYSGFLVMYPQSVSSGGVSTDIDHDPHAVTSYTDDDKAEVKYMSASGINASAFEATVWEPHLRPRNKPNANNGVSATHMLLYAAQTNTPIYSIKKSNLNSILPKLSLTRATLNDIRSAVASGKTVVVPQKQLQKGKWKGVGYIVLDEKTGAGGYLISGGKAGGGNDEDSGCSWCLSLLAGLLMLGSGVFAAGAFAIALVFLGIIAAGIDLFIAYQDIENSNLSPSQKTMVKGIAQMMFGIGAALAILGFFMGAAVPFVAIALYMLVTAIIVSFILGQLVDIIEGINKKNRELDNL